MSISERLADGLKERISVAQEGPSPAFPCDVSNGRFCDDAWVAIGRVLKLSPRQLAIARCVVAGQGDKQIAKALGLSWETVQTHLKRLSERLSIACRVQLTTRVCDAYRNWRTDSPPPDRLSRKYVT